ncbi:unnamed protein product [Trichogramma brassicae]|uniref:Uncharacterized protein n=1 Tax=Trichogramma brassicae TaxID=86971 RepID=A0A6H5IHU7_9HYME|nr:unnamed protein product [Trichogramma brassicae]
MKAVTRSHKRAYIPADVSSFRVLCSRKEIYRETTKRHLHWLPAIVFDDVRAAASSALFDAHAASRARNTARSAPIRTQLCVKYFYQLHFGSRQISMRCVDYCAAPEKSF